MGFELSSLNAKYRNLSEISYSQNAWRVLRVSDEISEAAYKALGFCWKEKFLGADHYGDLRSSLRDAYVALRSLVGSAASMVEHLNAIAAELEASIEKAENFLSDNERNLLANATEAFREYARAQKFPLADAVLNELLDQNRTTSLVIEDALSIPVAESFYDGLRCYSTIFRLMANLSYRDQNHVVIVASPDPARVNLDQIRRLLMGGETVKVTFVIPSWWSPGAAKRLNSELLFGLDGAGANYVSEIGSHTATDGIPSLDIATDWDLSIPPRPISKEIEKFTNSGPVPCNLLVLEQNLVMPIEVLATRLTVIQKIGDDPGFGLEQKSPMDATNAGDVVFSFAQVSEREFIREQADILLGDDLEEITRTQLQWKSRLQSVGGEIGWSALESRLLEVDVSKAHRVRQWGMDPFLIRPQADADLEKLLFFLGFDSAFSARVFEATRRINHARDSSGKSARKALAGAMTDEIWTNLQKGYACEISLEDMGEATFIASKIKSFDQTERLAGVLQVRRILGDVHS
jgi:hypothetical protein